MLVLPISERHHEYASKVAEQLAAAGLRVRADLRSEKVGFKIPEAQLQKLPFMLIAGDREVELGNVSVRDRLQGNLGPSSLEEFTERVGRAGGRKDSQLRLNDLFLE